MFPLLLDLLLTMISYLSCSILIQFTDRRVRSCGRGYVRSVGGRRSKIVGVMMFGGMGQAESQDRFGCGGEEGVNRVGNSVEV